MCAQSGSQGHLLNFSLEAPSQEDAIVWSDAPIFPPHHPPSCGGLFLHEPLRKPRYGINNKKITNWSRWITGLLHPTELPTSPACSLRDRDASTHQPTLSPLSGGLPTRPGILHSNLQETTATRVIRWTKCFQCWRGEVALSDNKELYFQLHIAGTVKHISRRWL